MGDEITRVNYFRGQTLRPRDFTDEQAYHVGMRRRHHLAHHTWGVVVGLELRASDDADEVFVAPGVAIDGYGRELVLPVATYVRSSAFDLSGPVLDVFLSYGRTGTDPGRPGRCDPGRVVTVRSNDAAATSAREVLRAAADAVPAGSADTLALTGALERVLDLLRQLEQRERGGGPAVTYDRWQESASVDTAAASLGQLPTRTPPGVPLADLQFGPTRNPPDDPAVAWPVYLGRVTRNPDLTYTVDPTGRPYSGLRGESLIAPSGRAEVRFGEETGVAGLPFAVFLPDPEATARAKAHGKAKPAAVPLPLLGVRADGRVDVRGRTTLGEGNLTLANGAVEFLAGTAIDLRNDTSPRLLRHWQIYREVTLRSKATEGDSNTKGNGTGNTTGTGTGTPPAGPPAVTSAAAAPATGDAGATGGGASGTQLAGGVALAGDDTAQYDDLVIEFPVGDPRVARNQFVIGSSTKDGKFFPSLTVDADGTVTVHGNLVVSGLIRTNDHVAGTATAATQSFNAALASTGQVLGSNIALAGAGPPQKTPDEVVDELMQTPGGPARVADRVTASPEGLDAIAGKLVTLRRMAAFVSRLATTPDAFGALADGLAADAGAAATLAASIADPAHAARMTALVTALNAGPVSASVSDRPLDLFVDRLVASPQPLARAVARLADGVTASNRGRLGTVVDSLAADSGKLGPLADSLIVEVPPGGGGVPRMDEFVDALAEGAPSHRMQAFAASLRAKPNALGALLDALAADVSVGGATVKRLDALADALVEATHLDRVVALAASLRAKANVLGHLADNLITFESASGGGTEARMDQLADALVANVTGGTTPRVAALLRSLGTPEALSGAGANTRMPAFTKVMEDSIVPETVAAPATPDPAKATGPGALFVKFALVQTSATDFLLPKLAGIMKSYKDPNF